MLLRLPLLLLLCTSVIFNAHAQQYIPYGAYVSSAGPFGQPNLRYQFADNILYASAARFTVTATSSGTVIPDQLFDGSYESQPCIVQPGLLP